MCKSVGYYAKGHAEGRIRAAAESGRTSNKATALRAAAPGRARAGRAALAAGPAAARRAGIALVFVLVQTVALDECQIRAPHTVVDRIGRLPLNHRRKLSTILMPQTCTPGNRPSAAKTSGGQLSCELLFVSLGKQYQPEPEAQPNEKQQDAQEDPQHELGCNWWQQLPPVAGAHADRFFPARPRAATHAPKAM